MALTLLSGTLVRCVGGSSGQASIAQAVLFTTGIAGLLWYSWALARGLRRSERWEQSGRCRECGYDRASIEITDPCPECGTVVLPVERWLRVEITAFIDTDQPGWVAAQFMDVDGNRWEFKEKIPVLTDEDIWSGSSYPRTGWLGCREVSRPLHGDGRVVRVRFDGTAPEPLNSGAVVEVSEMELRPR